MVTKSIRYTKCCPKCNKEQSYGRLDHYKSAIKGGWLCKTCSNHDNNFKGRLGPMPLTWFKIKQNGGIHRGYEWDLTPQDIIDMYEAQNHKCALSGLSIGWPVKGLTATASIDRIDSSLGYVKGNVQLLHKDVNMAKQQFSQDYFIKMCKAVAKTTRNK